MVKDPSFPPLSTLLPHPPSPFIGLLSMRTQEFSPGWFWSMVEATAQSGAECAESLSFFLSPLFFHSIFPSFLPSWEFCLFFCCLDSSFIIAQSHCRFLLQDLQTFLSRKAGLLYPDFFQEAGEASGVWSSETTMHELWKGEQWGRRGWDGQKQSIKMLSYLQNGPTKLKKNIFSWWH